MKNISGGASRAGAAAPSSSNAWCGARRAASGDDRGDRQADEQHGAERGLRGGHRTRAVAREGDVEVGHRILIAQRRQAQQRRAGEESEGERALAVPVGAEVGGRDEQERDQARHGCQQPQADDRRRDRCVGEVERGERQRRAPQPQAVRDERVEGAVRQAEHRGEDRDRGDLHHERGFGVGEQEGESCQQGERQEQAGLEGGRDRGSAGSADARAAAVGFAGAATVTARPAAAARRSPRRRGARADRAAGRGTASAAGSR
jgi:hypothetical protein